MTRRPDTIGARRCSSRSSAANRARARPPGARGNQVTDRADGRGGDLVEGGADAIVEAVGLAPSGDGGDRPERVRQMTRDSVENVLVAGAEDNVRAHAFRGLGHAPGDELGVVLAAAFRLAVGQVPLAVELPGRPIRMRVLLRAGTAADGERLGRRLVTTGVRDDVGAVAVGQHGHVGRPPRRGRRCLQQVRQRADPHRTRVGPGREPPGEQDLPVRRDHDPVSGLYREAGQQPCGVQGASAQTAATWGSPPARSAARPPIEWPTRTTGTSGPWSSRIRSSAHRTSWKASAACPFQPATR